MDIRDLSCATYKMISNPSITVIYKFVTSNEANV
jgi:hypothetical protein